MYRTHLIHYISIYTHIYISMGIYKYVYISIYVYIHQSASKYLWEMGLKDKFIIMQEKSLTFLCVRSLPKRMKRFIVEGYKLIEIIFALT